MQCNVMCTRYAEDVAYVMHTHTQGCMRTDVHDARSCYKRMVHLWQAAGSLRRALRSS